MGLAIKVRPYLFLSFCKILFNQLKLCYDFVNSCYNLKFVEEGDDETEFNASKQTEKYPRRDDRTYSVSLNVQVDDALKVYICIGFNHLPSLSLRIVMCSSLIQSFWYQCSFCVFEFLL